MSDTTFILVSIFWLLFGVDVVSSLASGQRLYVVDFLRWVLRQNELAIEDLNRRLARVVTALLGVLRRPAWRPSERLQLERVQRAFWTDPRPAWEHVDELERDIWAILCPLVLPQSIIPDPGKDHGRPTKPPAKPADAAWSANPGHPIWSQDTQTKLVAREIATSMWRKVDCPECDGSGEDPSFDGQGGVRVTRCRRCKGHGHIHVS